MADERPLYKSVRLSGALHAILALFIISIGIADRVEMSELSSNFPAKIAISIWVGCWVLLVGVFGVVISLRADASKPDTLKTKEVKIYLISIFISIGLVAILIVCYSVGIALTVRNEQGCVLCPATNSTNTAQCSTQEHKCTMRVTLASVIIYESVLELLAAVWTIFKCRPREQPPPERQKDRNVKETKPKGKEPKRKNSKKEEKPQRHLPNRMKFSQDQAKTDREQRPVTLLELSQATKTNQLTDEKL